MAEIINEYLIHNGKILKIEEFNFDKTKLQPGVYEVIRIIDSVPLFFEEHMSRFKASSKLLGFELHASDAEILNYIKKLIEVNSCKYGNIKVVINNLDKPLQDNYVYFMVSKYPSETEIEQGVHTILYRAERDNPNAKSTNLSFREKINVEILKHEAYEALLVNRNDEITEGSKSNFFAVQGKNVYTPPVVSVLPGVTRGYVIKVCKELGYEVIEKNITLSLLEDMDGVFLTGTSPQVLPISSIDEKSFSSAENKVIRDIRIGYENLVKEYISYRSIG